MAPETQLPVSSDMHLVVLSNWYIILYHKTKIVRYFRVVKQNLKLVFTHKHAHTENLFILDGQNSGISVASVQTFTVRYLAS